MTDVVRGSASRGPFQVMGVTQYCRIRGADTGGAYSVMEHVFPPGAGPAFLHSHPAQESIGIVEGAFELYSKGPSGKVAQKAGPGDIHHVVSNGVHGIKNVGAHTGRAFLVFHPADLQERLFEELHGLLASSTGPPDPTRLNAILQKHGFVLVEQPPP